MDNSSVRPDTDAHSSFSAGMYRKVERRIETIRVSNDEYDDLSISSSVPDLCNPQPYLSFIGERNVVSIRSINTSRAFPNS